MNNDNVVTISGRIGSDPELKFIPSGHAVCEFSLAHSRRKKDGDEWVDDITHWFRVVSWRKLAEMSANLPKGAAVRVTGKLVQETWDTAEGEKRSIVKVVADSIDLQISTVKDIESTRGRVTLVWGGNGPPPVSNEFEMDVADGGGSFGNDPF